MMTTNDRGVKEKDGCACQGSRDMQAPDEVARRIQNRQLGHYQEANPLGNSDGRNYSFDFAVGFDATG
jgi:hypothetical protein